jgi:predicted amidohydrolase YtcJ
MIVPGRLILLAYFCLAASTSLAADIILYNGNVVTVDKKFRVAEAIAIADGRIVEVGSNRKVRKLAEENTTMVDLQGKTVTPGFIDTHPHMIHVGSGSAAVYLGRAKSIEDIKQALAERVARTRPGRWIFTTSIGDSREVRELPGSLAENRWPSRYDLDEVAPDNPVYIPTPWGGPKPAILNSLALELMGITKDTPAFDKGIEIEKDAETGEPTGIIHGMHAYNWNPYFSKISRFTPRYPIPRLAEGLQRHIGVLNSRGLTAVYESHFLTESNVETVQYLLDRDRLNIRMKLALELVGAAWKPANVIGDWIRVLKEKETDPTVGTRQGRRVLGTEILTIPSGDKVEMLGATLSADGPTSFGKARMNVPYWDMNGDPATEDLPISVEKITQAAMLAARHDLRMNFPVGGDRMADAVLEALEEVNETYPLQGKNWVIAHTPYMSEERLQRIRDLGLNITANSNSEYKMTRSLYKETFRDLADDMAAINTPWRWILDSGVTAAQSTDNVFADPMFTLWHALKRGSEDPGDSLLSSGKKISREEAIRLQTIYGAAVLMWDDEIGSVEAGKFADLVILDTDILECSLDDIKDAKVLGTFLGGELVYGDLDSLQQ